MSLGKAKINILANLAPLKRGLANARAAVSVMVKKVARGSLNLLKSALAKISQAAKLAAASLVGIGIASIKIASDVQESDNLFKIAMGSMADEAAQFAKEYSESLNLFENDTRKGLSTFQLMITSMGIGEKEAFKMSKGLTMLANDIASFRNQKPEEVFLKLQSGITGEAEPLKRLGILINDSVLKQLALKDATIQTRLAMEGASQELTEAEKVMLRYRAILQATEQDQGDMARTLNDTANVFRQVWAQIKKTGDTIGTEFLPNTTKAGIAIREWLKENQDVIGKWAAAIDNALEGVVKRLQQYLKLAKEGNFGAIFKDIGKILGDVANGLVAIFERMKPVASDLGRQIAKGFMGEFGDTAIGKLLGIAGKAVGATVKGAEYLGEGFGIAAGNVNYRRNVVEPSRRTQQYMDEGRVGSNAGTLQELKKISQALERQNKSLENDRGF